MTDEELEAKVEGYNMLVDLREKLDRARKKMLSSPPPRSICPGCWSAIYDGAAAQGWCTDCYPKHSSYGDLEKP